MTVTVWALRIGAPVRSVQSHQNRCHEIATIGPDHCILSRVGHSSRIGNPVHWRHIGLIALESAVEAERCAVHPVEMT